MKKLVVLSFLGFSLAACASANASGPTKEPLAPFDALKLPADPELPKQETPVLLKNAIILTGDGERVEGGFVLFADGLVSAVGAGEPESVPDGTRVIDAEGRFVTPGVIDTHSHIGVYPWPSARAHADGNEVTAPTTPNIWAEHGFWPQDPAIPRAVANGVTTIQVLPGSANLVGGRSFTAKLHPNTSARGMRFPGAPQGVKMACGENPKRVYGSKGRSPMTRMGNAAGFRATFDKGRVYRRKLEKFDRDFKAWESGNKKSDPPEPPNRDLALETIAGILSGDLLVHIHCYRADDIHVMMDIAETYGFHVASFHHALESYKLADRLAKANVASSTWADWWGFKLEAYDGIPQNAAILHASGAPVIMHSDSAVEIQSLNQEAAKALTAGRKVGIEISEADAMAWITRNPARVMGIADRVGTLAPGKMADVVVWSGNPFSVYSKVEMTFIDGIERYAGEIRPTDFELGQPAMVGGHNAR